MVRRPEAGAVERSRTPGSSFRLSNPDESQMGGSMERRRAARNTLDRPGFGLTREGHEMLVGVPEITGTEG